MKKCLLFVVFAALLVNTHGAIGNNRHYLILSQYEYDQWQIDGHDNGVSRFFVLPTLDKNVKNIASINDDDARLAKFGYMLRRNKAKQIKKFINICDTAGNEMNKLIKGLYYFSEQDYVNASRILTKCTLKKYKFLIDLLIADCTYELMIAKGSLPQIIHIYQELIDKEVNGQNVDILKSRIRYFRYNI